ncbi:MAG: CRISPR system precrRNA processing endoribonuclease RAMP protein Cas6 [Acidobacteria bacterium]|nr:CRISPR system precrRNA processing endoribonuclease RAMP protein Cas6 [Acidobacteriota bacterium]
MISPAAAVWILDRIHYEERIFALRAEGDLDLPAYAGSTMRGAIGMVMRPELCLGRRDAGAVCGEDCAAPSVCPFYSLFEQSRAGGGAGENQPKPLIIETPLGEPLAAIAAGAEVSEPFELEAGRPVPVLRNGARWRVGHGQEIELVVRALGVAGAALDGVEEGIRQQGLEVKGGRLRLAEVARRKRRLGREEADGPLRRIRLVIETPLLMKGAEGTCFDPPEVGRMVLEQAVVRAVRIHNHLFARGDGKAPFVRPEWPGVVMTGHRLFRYVLPRHSYRQEEWMNFDGVVGWIEWEGEVGPLVPWLRAAEVVHVGQKAAFGLGRVRLWG